MPVFADHTLPAVEALAGEGVDILPIGDAPAGALRIGLLNLMPLKEMAETDMLRVLSATDLPVALRLISLRTHVPRHTSAEHMAAHYTPYSEGMERSLDGFIINGAPLERVAFRDVSYWPEITMIFDSLRRSHTPSLFICWAAFAAMYHHYGVDKTLLENKISGVFPHRVIGGGNRLTTGFDDEFYVPNSRFITWSQADLQPAVAAGVRLISDNPESGVYMATAFDDREVYITGHSEYAPLTLDFEYRRDTERGMNPSVPVNYYRDDCPEKGPVVRWRAHSRLLFANWISRVVAPARKGR